jgi:hypothetical protein
MTRKRNDIKLFLIIIAVALVIIAFQFSKPKACTMEAKICPDGSAVGRVPPNCDFAPCPETCKCPEGYVQEGDVCNPKCYYSTPKCLIPSFQCNITKSCESDSDCTSLECCHPTSCINKAYKGVCNELCTQVCQGPLDCGAGSCGCVNNRCTVIPK